MKKKRVVKGNQEPQRNSIRIRISKEELEMINQCRTLWNEAVESGINPKEVKHGWIKNDKNSLFLKNHAYETPEEIKIKKIFDKLIEDFKEYKPQFKKINYKKCTDPHLLVVDPADIHIGKLTSSFEVGVEYNSQIAVKRVKEGVEGILSRTKGYDIDKILFVTGNDILHVDNARNQTTKGTHQDTSGMWYDNVIMAKNMYVDVIEMLSSVAPVHCVFNPSNHDYMSGFMILQIIQAWFKGCKNVTFDADMSHRKNFRYHNNLIFTTHGDGAKIKDLPLLMATESEDWSKCKKRYIYIHHVHHYSIKDFIGVTLETMRSSSEADSWHHRNGYEHAPKAISGFLHHPKHGQVTKITYYF